MLLQAFQDKFSASCRLQVRRLETNSPIVQQVASLPKAQVHVVDASVQRELVRVLLSSLLQNFPKARVLVLADEFPEPEAFDLLELGVKGILRYADADAQFARAVASLAQGGYWVPRAILSQFVEQILTRQQERRRALLGAAGVSRREQDILDGLLKNLSNKEIANQLNISERTVKFHVSNLLAKYHVQRRADLILLSFHNQRTQTVGA